MTSVRNSVSTTLLAVEKCAVYNYCYAHALNIAVGTTLKQSKVCCEILEVNFEITKLIKFLHEKCHI